MRSAALLSVVALAISAPPMGPERSVASVVERRAPATTEEVVRQRMEDRLAADVAALQRHRPGYEFWQYVFNIPDGKIVYGSAADGRLLATFPSRGDWSRGVRWEEGSLEGTLDGLALRRAMDDRRDQVAGVLERSVGPVIHNPTRGDFLLPNLRRYGSFLAEWSTIYERFGVPADVGLGQAVVESGLAGTVKSEARAIGFCQWLPRNWDRLNRLAPEPIEAENQTTQAPFCAAYLSVLATKYGSFIPALSEHHAGGVNVGRTITNGQRLGGSDIRDQYFLGSALAVDLRSMAPRVFRQVIGTYGPRSHRYAEMVFGNTGTVRRVRETTPQDQIYGIRTSRAFTLADISERTGLSREELRRFNPALKNRVPKGANLYLPVQGGQFGTDVSFWHRPADPQYEAVLADFLSLQSTPEEWDDPAFDTVLRDFRRRFAATNTEEGKVMEVVLGYVMQEMPMSRRILKEYRTSPRVRDLLQQGLTRRGVSAGQ